MFDILFCNADIITMCDENPVIRGGYVGINGKHITYVGNERPEGKAKRCIDCCHKVLMPGLVNTHTHTAMSLLRGYADDYALNEWLFDKVFPVEARLTEQAIEAGVTLGFAEMLRTGTTSISDMYYFQPKAAQIALDCGIRASFCNGIIAFDADAFNPESDRGVTETKILAERFHNAGDGRIKADASIHAEYTSSPKIWHFVNDMADKYGLNMQIHLSETKNEHENCIEKYGKTPTAILAENGVFERKAIAAHCVWLSEDDMDILASKGVSCAHNPISNLKLASGIANVRKMLDHGMNVALGTDGCCSNNTHDLFEEIRFASLLAKGTSYDPTALCAYDTLKLATVNGALAQGRENEIGRIKCGLEADIILLDLSSPITRPYYDPISAVVYSTSGRDVYMTMIQGKILYENGEYKTIDIEKAIANADSLATKITNGE
ncbi:MAG: amidohydrolase [Clostridia bacterium]|nr:amidohydrolase [Clostridia bacterium]